MGFLSSCWYVGTTVKMYHLVWEYLSMAYAPSFVHNNVNPSHCSVFLCRFGLKCTCMRQVHKGRKRQKEKFEDMSLNRRGVCDTTQNGCVWEVLTIAIWIADKIPLTKHNWLLSWRTWCDVVLVTLSLAWLPCLQILTRIYEACYPLVYSCNIS